MCTGVMLHGYPLVKQLCGGLQVCCQLDLKFFFILATSWHMTDVPRKSSYCPTLETCTVLQLPCQKPGRWQGQAGMQGRCAD